MNLYLQFGHGMMGLCESLTEKWGGSTTILSPRDLKHSQMVSFTKRLAKLNGRVAIDPQFYMPHADHVRLTTHSFWPDDYQTSLFSSSEIRRMLNDLKTNYNDAFSSSFFILPNAYCSEVNDIWYDYNTEIINCAKLLNISQPIFITLCLSHDVICSEEQVHLILEYLEEWDIDGCYIIAEPPKNSYLVENPLWLINLLDLCAGIKQLSKSIVMGYCSHQMLCLALSQVDAIASGNWLNVRSFNTEKFYIADDSISRRSTWYYCPQALSEYQITYLDVAQRVGKIDELRTHSSFNSPNSDVLFSGVQPSSVNFNEREAFMHYLQCLKIQAINSSKSTYLDTRESLKIQLETASTLLSYLISSGVRGRNRDFSKVLDINLSAIDVFDQMRGIMQNYRWNR